MIRNNFFLSCFLFLILESCFLNPIFAAKPNDRKATRITAIIGQNCVRLFGYTSPLSKVELTSSRVYDVTLSDDTGYFEFSQTILPKNPSDLCLRTIDNDTRTSNPVCIPPPPDDNYNTDIGPIILPPTITIDTDQIKSGQTLVASGQSIPNSEISIHLYQKDSQPILLPKTANAFVLPQFTVKSDNLGNYNFNLPTTYSTNYRLLASVKYQEENSPLSNTIFFQLPSVWYLFWLKYSYLIIAVPVFFLSLLLLIFLLFINRKSYHHKSYVLVPWSFHHSCYAPLKKNRFFSSTYKSFQ